MRPAAQAAAGARRCRGGAWRRSARSCGAPGSASWRSSTRPSGARPSAHGRRHTAVGGSKCLRLVAATQPAPLPRRNRQQQQQLLLLLLLPPPRRTCTITTPTGTHDYDTYPNQHDHCHRRLVESQPPLSQPGSCIIVEVPVFVSLGFI